MINLGFVGICERCKTVKDLQKLESSYSKIINHSQSRADKFAVCPQTSDQMKEETQDNFSSDSGFIFNVEKNTFTKKPAENFAEDLVMEINGNKETGLGS